MLKRLIKKYIIFLALILSFVYFVEFTQAKSPNLGGAFSIPFLQKAGGEAGYDTSKHDPVPVINAVINVTLSVLGVVFLILIIYSGFRWMTARGNEQQLESAKNTMQSAIIGLIIVLAAYAISVFVIKSFATGILTTV